jgi:hypothetical protein
MIARPRRFPAVWRSQLGAECPLNVWDTCVSSMVPRLLTASGQEPELLIPGMTAPHTGSAPGTSV